MKIEFSLTASHEYELSSIHEAYKEVNDWEEGDDEPSDTEVITWYEEWLLENSDDFINDCNYHNVNMRSKRKS